MKNRIFEQATSDGLNLRRSAIRLLASGAVVREADLSASPLCPRCHVEEWVSVIGGRLMIIVRRRGTSS